MRQSQDCGIKIFGVVDENRRADVDNYILAFPEESPPEVSVFADDIIKASIKSEFGFDCDALSGDHHGYFDTIAKAKNEDVSYVKNRCIKLYIKNKGKEYYQKLVDQMSSWLSECD